MADHAGQAGPAGPRPICRLDELVDGSAQRYDVDGHRIAVVRVGDAVYAIGDRCSHADYSLSEGEVDADTLHLECWKHGSCFSLETGEPDSLPATRPVPVYPVTVTDGEVAVALPGEDPDRTAGTTSHSSTTTTSNSTTSNSTRSAS